MKKFYLKVTRKNGKERTVPVYLDNITARLLIKSGDQELLKAYLYEEYKTSRRNRQEEFWNRSLDEDMENGVEYEDKHSDVDFSFDNFEDERLQEAIKQLTPRQQEILRHLYIEGRTQKEIAELYQIDKRSMSDAVKRIYVSLKRNYKK